MSGIRVTPPAGAAGIGAGEITAAMIAANTITGKQLVMGTPAAAKELKEATSIEASPVATTTVYLSVLCKAESTVGEVLVSGVPVFFIRKETLVASSDNMHFVFRIKAGGKFEVKMTEGKIETEGTNKSVYTVQEG